MRDILREKKLKIFARIVFDIFFYLFAWGGYGLSDVNVHLSSLISRLVYSIVIRPVPTPHVQVACTEGSLQDECTGHVAVRSVPSVRSFLRGHRRVGQSRFKAIELV